jgi:heavy metal efflux system protein
MFLISRYRKLLIILSVLTALSAAIRAQEIQGLPLSLDDALDIAVKNNPEIRNASLDVDRSTAQIAEAWNFEPMSFFYRYGQMYGAGKDRYLEINQDFGSLLARIQQYKMAKQRVETSLSEFEIAKRSLTARVKSAYFFWWFVHDKKLLGEEETQLYDDMQRIAHLRYQAGDFSDLEKTMATAKAAEIKNNCNMLSDDEAIAENKLKQLLMIDDDLIPPAVTVTLYSIDKPSDTSGYSNTIVASCFDNRVALQSAALKMTRAKLFPDIFAGFFYQDIYPVRGLTGWHVGISIPLLAFGQASAVKEAKIEQEMAVNQRDYAVFSTDRTIENLLAELTKYFRQIQYYDAYGLGQAGEIIRNARLQFEKENISYLEYVQSLSMALSIKQQYLVALNSYNQTAIQLEFYAY